MQRVRGRDRDTGAIGGAGKQVQIAGGERPGSAAIAMDTAGRLSLVPEGAEDEAREKQEGIRQEAKTETDPKLRALYRRYDWNVQGRRR